MQKGGKYYFSSKLTLFFWRGICPVAPSEDPNSRILTNNPSLDYTNIKAIIDLCLNKLLPVLNILKIEFSFKFKITIKLILRSFSFSDWIRYQIWHWDFTLHRKPTTKSSQLLKICLESSKSLISAKLNRHHVTKALTDIG